jgi:ABC-type sugar transport system ATPase subunit
MPAEDSFDCVIGIRPEKIEIQRQEEAGIPGVIYMAQPAGSETTVHVNAGNTRLLAKEIGIKSYRADENIRFTTNVNQMIVFAKQSGRLVKRAVPD